MKQRNEINPDVKYMDGLFSNVIEDRLYEKIQKMQNIRQKRANSQIKFTGGVRDRIEQQNKANEICQFLEKTALSGIDKTNMVQS